MGTNVLDSRTSRDILGATPTSYFAREDYLHRRRSIHRTGSQHDRSPPALVDQAVLKKQWSSYVKTRRVEADLNQDTLAGMIGKSQPTISNWERGISLPDREDLPPLAEALGRPLAEVTKAAGIDAGDLTPEGDTVLIRPGTRLRVIFREGEPGSILEVDEVTLGILEAIVRGKKTGKERP